MVRSCWIRVGHNPKTGIVLRRDYLDKYTQAEGHVKMKTRAGSDAVTSQRKPRKIPITSRGWKRQGWIVSESLQRQHDPANTLILNF
jgi:hypothetical protein